MPITRGGSRTVHVDNASSLRDWKQMSLGNRGTREQNKMAEKQWELRMQREGATSGAPAGTNFGAASADLQKNQEDFIAARGADIDRDVQRGMAGGMSNMIASGLAGTTAVGGMQAGLTEAATRAKAGVAAEAQQRTDQLQFGYAGLAQQASEGAAGRQAQLQLGQMGADAAVTQAALSQPRIQVQQANTGQFEAVIQSLQKEVAQLRKSMGTQTNQGFIGQTTPSLF